MPTYVKLPFAVDVFSIALELKADGGGGGKEGDGGDEGGAVVHSDSFEMLSC